MSVPGLTILGIVADPSVVRLFQRTFRDTSDRVLLASDLAEGLAVAASEKPDLAFVDVSLGHNAGLALVHHLRAVAPGGIVYALSRADSLSIGAQAVALGGAGLIMMPPSGDELLTAASDVRARLAAEREQQRLRLEADLARRSAEHAARMAEVSSAADRAEAARKLADILRDITGARGAGIYLPAVEGVNELVRTATTGEILELPSFSDEMGLLTFARQSGLVPLALTAGRLSAGQVLLAGLEGTGAFEERFPGIDLIASQAALLLAYVAERERSARGSMKDLTTSAYTFAYFVDIAGREIDKARRYGRRFALATIGLDGQTRDSSNDLAEVVLSVVRDTDVLARVDEREFYLLMPETGGIGAQSCRRRVIEHARSRMQTQDWELSIGVATYPHDGRDLSRLLRAAKHRAERSRRSVVRTWGLEKLQLPEIVNELLARKPPAELAKDPEAPRPVEFALPEAIGVALAAIDEAIRGGPTTVAVAHHPSFGLSPSVRASIEHDRESVVVHSVDLRKAADCEDLQVLAVIAEHGRYLLMGRADQGILRGVHASDPLLIDLVTQRIGQTTGIRLLE